MRTGITEVVRAQWNSPSPAMVNVETGRLYINTPVFNRMPFEQRLYVLLHEAGHATLKTRSEDLADEFASNAYLSRGHSLKQSVFALTGVLNMLNPEHRRRANNQLARAQQFDKQKNFNNMNAVDRVLTQAGQFNEEPLEDFLGLGKKARQRREDRREDRQAHQLDKIAAGGGFGNTVGKIFQGIGSGIGGLLGGGGGGAAGGGITDTGGTGGTGGNTGDPVEPKAGMPTWAWILIAAVVIAIIIFIVMRRAKKKKAA